MQLPQMLLLSPSSVLGRRWTANAQLLPLIVLVLTIAASPAMTARTIDVPAKIGLKTVFAKIVHPLPSLAVLATALTLNVCAKNWQTSAPNWPVLNPPALRPGHAMDPVTPTTSISLGLPRNPTSQRLRPLSPKFAVTLLVTLMTPTRMYLLRLSKPLRLIAPPSLVHGIHLMFTLCHDPTTYLAAPASATTRLTTPTGTPSRDPSETCGADST